VTGDPLQYVNAHTHTFQRGLRDLPDSAGDFWSWRETMLALAERQTPDTVRATYADAYAEMRAAGYAALGEFHYLGLDEARAAAEAADRAGVTLVILLAAYARGGLERFRQGSPGEYFAQVESLRSAGHRVGLAPHSVRACPREWLEQIAGYAEREGLVLHVHADEQPREIEECLAEHGVRPIELLADTGCLGPRTTVVHATHADEHELDLLADSGTRICLCPTTEADLGDGFFPAEQILERRIGICIGSDSNVRIDPEEELRELEWVARRQALRRGVFSPAELLAIGTSEGAAALGIDLPRGGGMPARPEAAYARDAIRIVPVHRAEDLGQPAHGAAPAPAPQLTYRGGPLLGRVEVFTVFRGAWWQGSDGASLAADLNGFFDYVLASELLDQLGEYSVSGQAIGHGSRVGTATVAEPALAASISDAQIQQMLRQLMSDGTVPPPSANALSFLFLPPNVLVTLGGSRSCQAFCGYHNATGADVYYAVMPYPGCTGCAGGLALFDAFTSTSSHELCEAITDPVPGEGWYDDHYGEIGDICAWQTRRLGNYTVQLEWSNRQNACV
jgi:cytosine/adenosine deaminase-related metal-dependent hydrolase